MKLIPDKPAPTPLSQTDAVLDNGTRFDGWHSEASGRYGFNLPFSDIYALGTTPELAAADLPRALQAEIDRLTAIRAMVVAELAAGETGKGKA